VTKIVSIVEGHGEVAALPILIRRIAEQVQHRDPLDLPRPIRIKRQRLLKEGEFERAIELAARQSGTEGRILVLLDADADCPAELAARLRERAAIVRADRFIRVVFAKIEYEAWLMAAGDSLAGHRELDATVTAPSSPESLGDPKGWLSARMPAGRTYRETLDQPALTSVFDLVAARTAPSFDKMWRDVISLL
jgi:hypothetical protein